MPKITIDEKDYELDDFSAEAKAQLESMFAADTKIAELQRDLAIAQTARNAYAIALKEVLPKNKN